jgi:aldehyde dehydrogenase (NAD+)
MRNAMRESQAALHEAIVLEYGAPVSRADWMARYPADVIEQVMCDLEAFAFTTTVGQAQVKMTPLGVAGLITRGTAMPDSSAASLPLLWLPGVRQ